jgi:predicted ferric reductase
LIDRKNIRKAVLPPSGRLLRGILLGIGAFVVIAAACLIPLFSESSSQIVKTELEKWLVIVGKICGMTAGALLVLQFALSARFRWLDRICGLNRLFHIHRLCGFCAAILASFHPMLIFAPKAMTTGAIRLDLWPELLGAVILILLWGIVGVGIWRVFLNFSFDRWWLAHRVGVFVVIVFLAVHSYVVSEDFHKGWPRYAFFAAVVIYALMFLWVKVIKPVILRGEAFRVTDISLAGKDAYDIECTPEEGHVFAYTPGQFAFVTFNSRQVSAEEHPFTISSTPTNKKNLHFTIRCSGDFTSNVGHLKRGDTALIDGPYGLFSHLALVPDPKRELIMIAGGVGITPMLSMLRYMVDMNDGRRVTLVWSNRTAEDIVFRDEFQRMENRLKGLKVFHILTRRPDHTSESGRLDESKLRKLLADCSRKAMVFICGPPKMMESVDAAIRRIGFPKRSIKMERFAL